MTRIHNHGDAPSKHPAPLPGHWMFQDAEVRFSELVRRARSEGPQHVTVHGHDEVVVIAVEDFRRLQGHQTGLTLVEVLRSSLYPELGIVMPTSSLAPVRDVAL